MRIPHRFYNYFHAADPEGLKDNDMDSPDWGERFQDFLTQVQEEEPHRRIGERDALLEEYVHKRAEAIENEPFEVKRPPPVLKEGQKEIKQWKIQFIPFYGDDDSEDEGEGGGGYLPPSRDDFNQGDDGQGQGHGQQGNTSGFTNLKNQFTSAMQKVGSFFQGTRVGSATGSMDPNA